MRLAGGEQAIPDRLDNGCRRDDLETVLASVTGSRNPDCFPFAPRPGNLIFFQLGAERNRSAAREGSEKTAVNKFDDPRTLNGHRAAPVGNVLQRYILSFFERRQLFF